MPTVYEEVKTFSLIDLDISTFGAFDFDKQGPGKRIERSIKEQNIKRIKHGHHYAIEQDSSSNEKIIKKYKIKMNN